jgi:hypothetical protein
VRAEKQRVNRSRGRLLAPLVVALGVLTGFGLTGFASTGLADPSSSGATGGLPAPIGPDLTHPSRPAIPEDSSPRALARLAPAGVTTPVAVDPAVSNTEAEFASKDAMGGSEPSVALNAANTNQVVMTSFSGAFGTEQNAPLWYSTDAGATWTKEFTITPPPGRPTTGPPFCPCDQTVDYGRNGTLFGVFQIHKATGARYDVVSGDTTNPAAAASWQWNGTTQAQLTNNNRPGAFTDQPWLLVNRDRTMEKQDDVWAAYSDFQPQPCCTARVAVSNNAAPPNFTVDNSPGAGPAMNAWVSPGLRLAKDPRNGWMYALWQTTNNASTNTNPHTTELHINRSTNGGAEWTLNGNPEGQALPAEQVDNGCTTLVENPPKSNEFECTVEYKFATVNALLGGVHHAAVDPTNGDVYVVYGRDTANTGVGNQLYIRRLTDNGSGGLNVGAEVTISIAASTALPSVAVTSDGTIGVLYDTFENEFSEPPGLFPRMRAHLAVSTDHGVTFKDTVLETFLSPSRSNGVGTTQRVLGDFQQLKANGDLLYGTFSGNRVPFNGGKGTSVIDPIYFSANTGIAATGGFTVNATEGTESSPQTVATFTDPDPKSTAAEYKATIEWGDGSSSEGTISGPTGGPFTVSGSHTYAEEGEYDIKVTITDTDDAGNTATVHSTAKVADAALHSSCAAAPVSLQAFAGPTATFTDDDPGGMSPPDYGATIEWGDSSSSSGTVSPGTGHGPYTVSGAHTYTTTGTFTITTTIKDAGGSQTVATCKTLVFAFAPGGGSFVIGDKNSAIGTHVLFWGAQWAKENSLSGGAASPSFKGFAKNPAQPSCGTSWTSRPGNSSRPPSGPLPADMGVIVSSTITKSGSKISGDTAHIVVVKTDPGYQPNPGHPGTGTVEAQFC